MQNPTNPTKTPIFNRVFFTVIAVFFALASMKVVYWAMYQGKDGMKFPLWFAVFGTAILGYFLISMAGDIKLRVSKIWTPLGLLMIAWICYFMVLICWPHSNGLLDLLANQSSETYLFAISFGLLIAFVDTKCIYKYAYYFLPFIIFVVVYQLAAAFVMLPLTLIQSGFRVSTEQIYEMNDIWVLLSVFLYGYHEIKRFRTEGFIWKRNGGPVVIFIAAFLVLMVLNGAVLSHLPPSNWFFRWIRA